MFIKYGKYTLVSFLFAITFVLNANLFGQESSVATATATIIPPISIIKVRDLYFGNIVSGVTSGTVILDPSAASSRFSTGGVTLHSASSTVQSAKFVVSGADGYSFSVILPGSIIVSDGIHFMTADNFTNSLQGSGVLTSGSQPIYVGATLHVNANQPSGIYKSTENFEVNVIYD